MITSSSALAHNIRQLEVNRRLSDHVRSEKQENDMARAKRIEEEVNRRVKGEK